MRRLKNVQRRHHAAFDTPLSALDRPAHADKSLPVISQSIRAGNRPLDLKFNTLNGKQLKIIVKLNFKHPGEEFNGAFSAIDIATVGYLNDMP